MRILLADDQPAVRYALRVLLERQPGLEVIGEAADAAALLAQAEVLCPNLVLVDWPLPGASPEELICGLHRVCPKVPIIALSGRPEASASALRAGADSFVSKGDPPEELLAAILECRGPIHPQSNASHPSLSTMLQSTAW